MFARSCCSVPRSLSARSVGIRCPTTNTRLLVTMAITRQVSPNLANGVTMQNTNDNEPLSLTKAQQQHDDYVLCLKRLLPAVQELPPLPNYPDSCFVEDTVVVIDDTAVFMNMGHVSRRGEVESIASVLKTLPGIHTVLDMKNLNSKAMCDGGDVLVTGRHVFVGLSERTNKEGVEVLREVYSPRYEVIAVPVVGALHLKSLVTHMDSHTLVAPTGALGDGLLEEMQASKRGYEVVRLPNVLACNVVAVNGTILAQDVDCKVSKRALKEAAHENNLGIEFVDTSDLAKVDAALTCCSILLDVK